jgi:DNA-binding transcriptional regulator YdaS (Cro superfamily)
MKLTDYLKAQEISQIDFANQIGVTSGMLNQWISGHRPIAPHQCVLIEKSTQSLVTRKDLRPNDWLEIWPELKAA